MKKKIAIALLSTFLLSGCLAERIENAERLKADEADYRKCLLEHTSQPNLCDALKQLYEDDKASM